MLRIRITLGSEDPRTLGMEYARQALDLAATGYPARSDLLSLLITSSGLYTRSLEPIRIYSGPDLRAGHRHGGGNHPEG